MLVGCRRNRLLHRFKVAHLPAEFAEPRRQPRGAQLRGLALLPVGGVEHAEVALDAGVHLLHPAPDRDRREVAVARIHRPEAATVHCNGPAGDEAQVAADEDEPSACCLDGRAMIAPEVGDRLEVGRQLAGQPHQLDVAARLAL